MCHQLAKFALTAKSLMGLGVAYEVASAGRVIAGICIASAGLIPHLWTFAKNFVECPIDPERFDQNHR